MRTLRWSRKGRRQYETWLAYLSESGESTVATAYEVADAAIESLCDYPYRARESRWPGLREFTLARWRKIAVYRVTQSEIEIVAFYDGRQDLDSINPDFE